MGIFEHFPYTNFHELNLDWILRALKELEHTIDQFVAINALKYADPIQWNITSQYEKNTIVIDPVTGTAYISVQPVASGIALTNTDYWTIIFDLSSFVVKAAKNLTSNYEEATTLTATFPTNAGDWLVWGDALYEALVNITAGDAYVVDSNIKQITMEEIVGHLDDLSTTDKSNLVAAINEVNLKASLFFNTVNDMLSYNLADGMLCQTGGYNSLHDKGECLYRITTNSINASSLILSNGLYATPINPISVKQFGAVGDGITDDTLAFNLAFSLLKKIYVPAGVYIVNNEYSFTQNSIEIYGDTDSVITDEGSIIKYVGSNTFLTFNINGLNMHDICIDGNGAADFSNTTGCLIKLNNCYNVSLTNMILQKVGNALEILNSWDTGLQRIKLYYCNTAILLNTCTNICFYNTTLYRSNVGIDSTTSSARAYDLYFDHVYTEWILGDTSFADIYGYFSEGGSGMNRSGIVKAHPEAWANVHSLHLYDNSGQYTMVKVDSGAGIYTHRKVAIYDIQTNNSFNTNLAADCKYGIVEFYANKFSQYYPTIDDKVLLNLAYPKYIHGDWINSKYRKYSGIHVSDHSNQSITVYGTDITATVTVRSPLGVEQFSLYKSGANIYQNATPTLVNITNGASYIFITPSTALQANYGEIEVSIITNGRLEPSDCQNV